MIQDGITYYREAELQRSDCACCNRWRSDIIIKEGLCIDCFEIKTESIERIFKTLNQ